jgi:AcrR family transcriptional regulator
VPKRETADDLREACIREALNIIEREGLEKLSLREVSRRLGVSHQAPYKHFPSRDHILAEIVRRAFDAFGDYLDAQAAGRAPEDALTGLGRAYLEYAAAHPLQYRLMFGTPLPDPAQHPDMMRSARRAFTLLHEAIARLRGEADNADPALDAGVLDALFVWATMHGLAGIRQAAAVETLGLPAATLAQIDAHGLRRVSRALGLDHHDEG